jgi:cold-inducible RNA-binding protein
MLLDQVSEGQLLFSVHSLDLSGNRKMETKLYIGNLPYSATEEELRTLFSQAGTVGSVDLIKDRMTGNSKGFGFIEMSNQSEAEKAISMFNGYQLGNRELKVNPARPKEESGRGGFGSQREGNGFGRGGQGDNRKGGPRRF